MGILVILDLAISVHGGAAGHDVAHAFTAAGAHLTGAAPGGILGIGVAMALGVWSWVGFEAGAVYGEETRHPRRAVPIAIFSVVAFLTLLYVWTSYAATIGVGWTHAVDQFGTATLPYYALANQYVGGWLQILMVVAISTSALACGLAFHNGMVRYLYAMGREHILPAVFGKTPSQASQPTHRHYRAIALHGSARERLCLRYANHARGWQHQIRFGHCRRAGLYADRWY